ncbi:MAG: hypothetical protein E6J63_17485 [Deltaproteobacteria bacterium]|nr:MAG: hypothetical protein E6J63_17485 [Deltaproteobacteria bacterium]
MPDKNAVIDLIDRGIELVTNTAFSLYLYNNPAVADAIRKEFDDPNATVNLGRKDGSNHARRLHQDLAAARTPGHNLKLLRDSFGMVVISVGDTVLNQGFHDGSALKQFLRHLRNACAHGNRWFLKSGEPKKPAKYRNFEVTSALDGTGPVFFDFMGAGDVLDLFEDLKKSL